MGDEIQELTRQNTPMHYLKRSKLESKLKQLFPGISDFKIKMQNDQYSFIAPRRVRPAELASVRETQSED